MARREDVKQKRGFTTTQYQSFASKVGHDITFNRRMKEMAKIYAISIYQLGQQAQESKANYLEQLQPIEFALHHTSDPIALLLAFQSLNETSYEDTSTEGLIAREIGTTSETSFRRFGDVKKLNRHIRQHYLASGGLPLDSQAAAIAEAYQMPIEPEDLVEFMYRFPQGPGTYQNDWQATLDQLAEKFRELTGFRLCARFANRFTSEVFGKRTTADHSGTPF